MKDRAHSLGLELRCGQPDPLDTVGVVGVVAPPVGADWHLVQTVPGNEKDLSDVSAMLAATPGVRCLRVEDRSSGMVTLQAQGNGGSRWLLVFRKTLGLN